MLVVLDTDALLAIADVNDALHLRATALAKKLSALNANVLLSPTTLAEFAMVATHHIGFPQTKKAVDTLYKTYSLFQLDTVLRQGIVNLIPHQGYRLADSTHDRTIRGYHEGTWRIRPPFARPLSCSRPRNVHAAPHDRALREGDDGEDKSANEWDHGQPESVGRGLLI